MADTKLLDQVCRDYIALQGHSWKVLFRGMDKWSEVLRTMVASEVRELYRKRAARIEMIKPLGNITMNWTNDYMFPVEQSLGKH